jgi:hypothetical protein
MSDGTKTPGMRDGKVDPEGMWLQYRAIKSAIHDDSLPGAP